MAIPETLTWGGGLDGPLTLIDQRRLPAERVDLVCATAEDAWEAIKTLAVRGAPAIGVSAAYGLLLGLRAAPADAAGALALAEERAAYLKTSRPTAVNLAWALDRMLGVARRAAGGAADSAALREVLRAEAVAIHDEDRAMCRAIGEHGAALVPQGARVLTHCNAGALATAGIGTALGVIYTAHEQGKALDVFARETRPLLQGSRITAFELKEAGVQVTLIADGMAGALMRTRGLDLIVVGADRIARNGDVANKIGTYALAVLAKEHGVRFVVAAPSSTFDLSLASGEEIPIEERDADELRSYKGLPTAPADVDVWNPAFDVTPAALVSAIVTERGVIEAPDEAKVVEHLADLLERS